MAEQKTVFISYRRDVSQFMALAIFQNLRAQGYDVFYDFNSIDSGQFERIILGQIAARAHFLPIITHGTLERCQDPNDWVRREIEEAMRLERNIVPLLLGGFTWRATEPLWIGDFLMHLQTLNSLNIPIDYFEEAMSRLRNRYLKQPVYVNEAETSVMDQGQVQAQIQHAAQQAPVTEANLTAEEYFNQGYEKGVKGDSSGAIAHYTEAICLNPDYAEAYNNRGNARKSQGDLAGALADYHQAIHLKSDFAEAYNNRGVVRKSQGDLVGAMADYNEALRLNPNYAEAYNNRGNMQKSQGDLAGALADYHEAILLKSDFADAYNNRGVARKSQGDLAGALADYNEAIRLKPDFALAYKNRGIIHHQEGKLWEAIQDWEQYLDLGGSSQTGDYKIVENAIRELKAKL